MATNDRIDAPLEDSYDVVVVGGGVMGSATAWHLVIEAPGLSVLVVEPDPTYAQAASSVSSGGVRQLFTCPENVLMSQYTLELIETWQDWVPPDGVAEPEEVTDLGWHNNGYLFVTTADYSEELRRDYERQRDLGVRALWLEPTEIAERYPLIEKADLGPGVLSTRDGWLDPAAFLAGMKRRARRLGAEYVRNSAVGFETSGRRVTGAVLASGETVSAGQVVNVAGVWGPGLSRGLGLDLPVEPMRRFDHFVETPEDFSAYPFIKDPAGLAVRPEGQGLNVALVDFSTVGGWDLSIDRSWFEEVVWPALVERIPSSDHLRLSATWSGHYDQNRFDGNMILDGFQEEYDNFWFATGFSGHGLMHAPAVGRALAELVVHGGFRALDLTRMGKTRIAANEPYREVTVR